MFRKELKIVFNIQKKSKEKLNDTEINLIKDLKDKTYSLN